MDRGQAGPDGWGGKDGNRRGGWGWPGPGPQPPAGMVASGISAEAPPAAPSLSWGNHSRGGRNQEDTELSCGSRPLDCGLVTHGPPCSHVFGLGSSQGAAVLWSSFHSRRSEAPGRGARRGQRHVLRKPRRGALRTGWGCDRTCTHTQTRMHTQTQTHTQTHKSMQTCAPSHPTHTGMHKAHPETHTSHTHTHMLGHRSAGKTHTHTHTHARLDTNTKMQAPRTHTHSGTDTQTHQRTHADHTSANAQTRTHPATGAPRQPRARALQRTMLASLHGRIFSAAFT